MNFDLIIPTYNRREKLERCLTSIMCQILIDKKLDKHQIKIFVYFDNNDEKTYKYIKERYDVKCILLKEQNLIFKISNYHFRNSSSDGVFYFADDLELLPNYLNNSINALIGHFPDLDGVIGIYQYNLYEILKKSGFCQSAHCLIGRKYINRFPNQQVFCPDYRHFVADVELEHYAKRIGKFYFGKEIRLNHFTPEFYPDIKDENRKNTRNNAMFIDGTTEKKKKKERYF